MWDSGYVYGSIIISMHIRVRRSRQVLIILAISGALAVAGWSILRQPAPPVQAYSNQPISPVPTDMRNESNGAVDNTIRHVLKKETSSTIDTIQMAAYFNNAGADTAHRIQITDRDTDAQRCHTYTAGRGRINTFIYVTLSVSTRAAGAAAKSITYVIRSDRVCMGSQNHVNSRTANNNATNQFFSYYDVPSGFTSALADPDPDTGLYRVGITIRYAPGIPRGTTGTDDDLKQQITFKTRLANPCGATATSLCTRYISTVPIGSGGRNYSTLGPNVRGNQYYTSQAFKFGLPCPERQARTYTVSVYDTDNGTAWVDGQPIKRAYVVVQWLDGATWRTLSFNNNQVSGATLSNGNTRITPVDNDQATTRISVNMQPATNYRIVVAHVHARNLLGIGLPTETIFGELNCNYNLVPNISTSSTSVPQGGIVGGVTGRVVNNGSVQSYGEPSSAVVRFVLPRGASLTRGSAGSTSLPNSSNYGCQLADYVSVGMRNCTMLYDNDANFPVGTTTTYSGNDSLSGVSLDAGDRVCYLTVVNLYNQPASNRDWRYSNTICLNVITKPGLQVWGNDVRVGSPFVGGTALNAVVQGSISQYGSRVGGSWGEYGVIAPNGAASSTVTNFASGAGLESSSATANPATWSNLTFSNTNSARLGWFDAASALGVIPDVRGAITAAAAKAGLTVDTTTTNVSSYSANRVILSNGTVRISGNIDAPNTAANEGSLRQMVIIANSILIDDDVTNVDAWLIASGGSPGGIINTCGNRTTPFVAGTCDKELRINGPLMARLLLARRTGGGNGDPAEIYNLRSDSYIWAYHVAQANSSLTTVYSQELPPRF